MTKVGKTGKGKRKTIYAKQVPKVKLKKVRETLGNSYKLIDAFSGAGGLTLGFSGYFGHNFKSVWANDINLCAVRTYNENFGKHCTCGDVVNLLKKTERPIPKADVVIGGPPCQGFSLLNRNREGDSRKQLWRPYMDIVKKSEAQVFLMENVPQLLGSPEHAEILEVAKDAGFKVVSAKVCAADYGVPQTRNRAFILGSRFADPSAVFPPKKTNFNPNNCKLNKVEYVDDPKPWKTVRDAISDLPEPKGTEIRKILPPLDLHFGRNPTELSKRRYEAIPEEGMNRIDLLRIAPDLTPECWKRKDSGGTDLFGRLWWDKPAVTIRTEFFKPEKGRFLHPSQHRPMTHREAARFQSFPDSFKFVGPKIEIARQIGNAVPPLLASRVADSVYELLEMGS
jgi:DNA (cytosine-5)-methyltransferase 1